MNPIGLQNPFFARPLGLLAVLVLCLLATQSASQARESDAIYTNPVSRDFADTFADPAVIKAKDGYWYAFGTTDPLREGEGEFHTIPISRSKNLVDWKYVGDAFDESNRPSWAAENGNLWAPDIRYLDGEYYMYYVVTQTDTEEYPDHTNDNAIGVATAPSPTGPWTDSGEPVVGPRPGNSGNPDDFKWTFDPSEFTDSDGKRYLYYGSYYGGIFVTELSEDGTEAVGDPEMVAIDNRYEGAYVIRHDRFYYLFASSADCCAGPTTGYSVFVGRSESPTGPFVDREGVSMNESRVGGSIVVTPNGNKWVGPGHNSIVTDLSGRDRFVYHAIDWKDPYLDGTEGINERPMLLDRLDWINGWPTVRGGEWASASPQPVPITDGPVNDAFNSEAPLGRAWETEGGAWHITEVSGERFVRQRDRESEETFLVARTEVPSGVRVEGDLRLGVGTAAGVVARYVDPENYAAAWLDRDSNALVTDVMVGGVSTGEESTLLPEGFDFDAWHSVAVEMRGTRMTAEVTDARLNDPYAVARRTLPPELSGGRVGVAARGRADADNVSAARLYRPQTEVAEPPEVGALAPRHSDEFDDESLERSWSWVGPPDGEETGGAYRWQVQETDITRDSNDASLLLRDAPDGDYVVETKLTIDLGTDEIRNYQQGGLIAYVTDDRFVRLSHVAIWNTRQTEFGKEMPYAGRVQFGGMLVGPPAETTYLRLAHSRDPNNGEHEFRAATSRNGTDWVWGGVWTMPQRVNPRIGLVSLGKQTDAPAATSEFDYFRVYR